MGGIQVSHVHVDLHKRSVDKRTNAQPATGGEPEDTNDVHYALRKLGLCCTFVNHAWVSESTIIRHEEEILSMELNYKIGVPCVVQWSLLWFSAPTRKNIILGLDLKIKKYHEAVNIAIKDAVVRPFGGAHTEVVHVDIGGKGLTQYTQEVWSKQGWMIRGSLAPSSSDGDLDEDESSDE